MSLLSLYSTIRYDYGETSSEIDDVCATRALV
jgi:hypothetical protein